MNTGARSGHSATVSGSAVERGRAFAPWAPRRAAQRRRYRRWHTDVALALKHGDATHLCTASDISPGDATVHLVTPCEIPVGTSLSVQFEGFGRVAATVRRSCCELLGIKFRLGAARQRAFSEWLLHHRPNRRRVRLPCDIEATLVTADGELPCQVTDLSSWGAGVRLGDIEATHIGRNLVLLLPGNAPLTAAVRHATAGVAGLSFFDVLCDLPSD